MSTRRIKLLAALAAVLAVSLLTLAGCKVGQKTAQDFIDENGATASVVYYANEGRFNDSSDDNTLNIYYKPNSPVLNIQQKAYISGTGYPSKIFVDYTNYVLDGWEYAELDQNGNPVFIDADGKTLYVHVVTDAEEDLTYPTDDKGNLLPVTAFDNENGEVVFRDESTLTVKSSGVSVDFSKKIEDGSKWYFVASWIDDVRLEYILVCDEQVTITVTDEEGGKEVTTYSSGDIINVAPYGKGTSLRVSSYAPATDNATYLMAYADSECTQLTESVAKPTDGNNAQVYVKYLPGKWDLVKTPLEVSTMFANLGLATKQFYIFNDIDCSNISISPYQGDCKCIIEGNGYTLKNLTANQSNLGNDTNISLFGTITAGAKITDLNIENLTVRLETRNNIKANGLYLFCNGIEEGAELTGIQLVGASLMFSDAKQQSAILNLPYIDGTYTTDNWMFGGLGTDAAFLAAYDVTVNGYSLVLIVDSIKDETEILVSVDPNL